MRTPCRYALIVGALPMLTAHANEVIKPTLALNDLQVIVSYVSTGEFLELHRQYGPRVNPRELRQDHRHGFSILKTHRETGARKCEIYLPNDQRPGKVDDDATLTLGHELLHCMLGDYHR